MRTIICKRCKSPVETNAPATKYCETCAKIVAKGKNNAAKRVSYAEKKAKKAAESRKEKKIGTKSLKEIADEARAHGMSYGQWVATGWER